MNRSNTSASFDIVHVLLDIIVLAVAFLLSALFFGSGVAENEWRPIISIFVVGTIIFLTCNRTSQIYNNTLFFYIDRIIRRETMSFFVAVVCGEIIYYNCINDSNFGSTLLLRESIFRGVFTLEVRIPTTNSVTSLRRLLLLLMRSDM